MRKKAPAGGAIGSDTDCRAAQALADVYSRPGRDVRS